MGFINFHVHSEFCHGIGSPEEYVKAAIKNNVESIGFSSHAPLPFKKAWTMKEENLKEYCNSVEILKSKYKNRISIFLGFEVDYIPELRRFDDFRALGADYIIGSNHFIGKDKYGRYQRIESIKTGVIIEKDPEHYIRNYFDSISNMVIHEKPDIVGHFVLIKKINLKKQYFDQEDKWYQNTVNKTLKIIENSNTIIEVNTSKLTRNSSQWLFPSIDILEKCYSLNIPITLGSDAHIPEDIIAGYTEAFALLRDIGFKTMMTLTSDGWKQRII